MPAHVTPVIGIQSPGSPQSSSNRNGRTTVSSSVARSTTPASISSATGLQTTTLNGVVATQKSSGHASSRPPRIAQRVGMTENGSATDDAPAIVGLQDQDETLDHAAALASPLKGSDSRELTKVSSTRVSQFVAHINIVDLGSYQGFA